MTIKSIILAAFRQICLEAHADVSVSHQHLFEKRGDLQKQTKKNQQPGNKLFCLISKRHHFITGTKAIEANISSTPCWKTSVFSTELQVVKIASSSKRRLVLLGFHIFSFLILILSNASAVLTWAVVTFTNTSKLTLN